MIQSEQLEIAWAAGFFDGEGSTCTTTNNGKKNTRIQLSIGQKNLSSGQVSDTLYRFQSALKVGHIYRKTKTGQEINQHQFLVCKQQDVVTVLRKLWPYLSVSKKEQAKRAFLKFTTATNKEIRYEDF